MTRIGILATLCGNLLLARCGSNVPSPPAATPASPPGLELRLSATGEQRRDRILVTATVLNKFDRPVAWDSLFSVHVGFVVKGEPEATIEEPSSTMAPKPTQSESENRFVVLKPGESFSKDIDFTQPYRVSVEGHGTYPGGGHKGIFYEEIAQRRFKEGCKQVTVSLAYSTETFAWGALEDWLGEGKRHLPFWRGRVESNPVTMTLQER